MIQLFRYELKKYQISPLPLAVWLERPTRLYQIQHVHDCFEFVFVLSGTGWCAVNGLRFPILRNDLYVLRPGDVHEFTNNPGMRFYNIMFSGKLFSAEDLETFAPLLKWHGKYTLPDPVFSRAESLLKSVCAELENKQPAGMMAAKSSFFLFLVELLRLPVRDAAAPDGAKADLVSNILAFVTSRCRERITLDDLARETGGTPEYAGRRFRSLMGISFTDYLNHYRIELACGKLENTALSISEIAADLGFYDTPYFDKCFRKILGISPKAYREQRRKAASSSRAKKH